MKNIAKIVVAVGLVLVLFAPHVGAVGLGVAPTEITIEDALKGGEFEKRIRIFNIENETGRYELSATGDIKDWVSFHDIDNGTSLNTIHVPGESSKDVHVRFTIPGDAASGNYISTIYVQTIPEELTNITGSIMASQIKMPVKATIIVTGTQVLTGAVASITTMDVEVDYPLRIGVDFQNTGNVIAKPEIKVDITKNETLVDSFVYSKTELKPNTRVTIPVEWNTTGREAGDYVASVSVSLGGEVLAEKVLPFKILARGTLTRKGTLDEISYDGTLGVGIFIKIIATFKNTGEIDSDAQFKGEVYVNGDFVKLIESDVLTVPAKETDTLTSYLKPENPGDYTVKGHVIYDNKKTVTKETSFNVPVSEEEPTPKPSIPGFESALAIAGLLVVAVAYLVRRRK